MRESNSHLMPTQFNLTDELRSQLDYWYERRRSEKCGTIDLLSTVTSVEDKKIISVIALMDIDQTLLSSIINKDERNFICACHGYLSQRTKTNGIGH